MKSPEQNIVNTLKGKKILFIENDTYLSYQIDGFSKLLKRNKIEYTLLNKLQERNIEEVKQALVDADVIVFMTQWVYDISSLLYQFAKTLDKKIVVECYISEPTWYYSTQHGSKHDVYIFNCDTQYGEAVESGQKFYKLTEKAYWDYKNKFDK